MKELVKFKNDMLLWKEENLGFLNINLSPTLKNLYPTVHSYYSFFITLYCIVSTDKHLQVEGVRSTHGGSLRYEGIGQIQNF